MAAKTATWEMNVNNNVDTKIMARNIRFYVDVIQTFVIDVIQTFVIT